MHDASWLWAVGEQGRRKLGTMRSAGLILCLCLGAARASDLDGDGVLDAATVNYLQGNTVWLNRVTASSSNGVALGDLDGDGDLDAMVANYDQPNSVWINDGTGTVTRTSRLFGSSESTSVALGDLDGDGDLDAMVANCCGMPNRVWFNDGTGNFTDSGQALGTASSSAVALGDLDGDGDLDAMVANDAQPNRVWLNDGTGTFTDSGQTLGNASSSAVALGDLDRDGDLDAMVANGGQPNIVWSNAASNLPDVYNQDTGLWYASAREAIAAAKDHDVLVIARTTFDIAGTVDLRSRPLTFLSRSFTADLGPDLLLLAAGNSSFISHANVVAEGGQTSYRLEGALVTPEDESILFSNLDVTGTLTQSGASLIFEDDMNTTGGTAFLEGEIFCNDGMVTTGIGGTNKIAGDTNVLGDYTNAGTTIVKRGILYIYGDLVNTGTLSGEIDHGFARGGGGPRPGDGHSIGGDYRVGSAASLVMPDPVWRLQVGGDLDIAIDDPDRFDLSQATIRLTGLAPGAFQTMETLSADLGAFEEGFDPSNFPIGTLRISRGSETTLVNDHPNSTEASCEVLYVDRIVVEKGAILTTNGCRIYAREATILGVVDSPEDIVIVAGCPADLNGDSLVDAADLGLLIALWGTDGGAYPDADLDGTGSIDAGDLGLLLASWGFCP